MINSSNKKLKIKQDLGEKMQANNKSVHFI